ncbi:MAG: trypsin-like peptidase domain-containing protein [Nitrospira sp.]|nr:trypsin-like peptidase domain-containing protein [Nitrospira sp.]
MKWGTVLFAIVAFVLAALAVIFSERDGGIHPALDGDAKPEIHSKDATVLPGLGNNELTTISVFERTSRSVVFIVNRAVRRDLFFFNPVDVPKGSGSGIVWDESGHIVTNFHVVYGADAITIGLGRDREYEARVVGASPDHDLAVLRVQAQKDQLIPLSIGTSHDVRVGQNVLAIGNPFGLDYTLTTGVVSAVGRSIKSMTGRTIEGVIQTDAAINPGNSGGPLLDGAGRLIGINTQIVSPSGAFAGIGFAIPVDMVNRVVPQLIRYGKVVKAGIGVSVLPDTVTVRWGVRGVVIRSVVPGGPADRAGLQGIRAADGGRVVVGDVVTAVDGEMVRTVDGLLAILDRHGVGDLVTIEVEREGVPRTVTLTLQSIDQAAVLSPNDRRRS